MKLIRVLSVFVLVGCVAVGTGCWTRLRNVHGSLSVVQANGEPVVLSDVYVFAYPKGVAKGAFAKAGTELVAYFSHLRTELEEATKLETELKKTHSFTGHEAEFFAELVSLINLRDALAEDPSTREPIERRIDDVKYDAKKAGMTAVLQRFEKVASAHARAITSLRQLKESAPAIGRMLVAALPEPEIIGTADDKGHYSVKIPTGAPYVVAATAKRRGDSGDGLYCWIVPVRAGLTLDLEIHLTNANLFTDLEKTKAAVGLKN
jgi:hypothetical protein